MRITLVFVVLVLLTGSCSINHIEKRRYKSGWYISSKNSSHISSSRNIVFPVADTIIAIKTASSEITDSLSSVKSIVSKENKVSDFNAIEPAGQNIFSENTEIIPLSPKKIIENKFPSNPDDTLSRKPKDDEEKLRREMNQAKVFFIIGTVFTITAFVLIGVLPVAVVILPLLSYIIPLLMCGVLFSIIGIVQNNNVINKLKKSNNSQLKSKKDQHSTMVGLGWMLMILGFVSLIVSCVFYILLTLLNQFQ
ncbi:MAG: hypothetical protein MUC87_13970 [Bacteroidia bacterium]|nr:hypothetical protein [Bacteroidia bacterium]